MQVAAILTCLKVLSERGWAVPKCRDLGGLAMAPRNKATLSK